MSYRLTSTRSFAEYSAPLFSLQLFVKLSWVTLHFCFFQSRLHIIKNIFKFLICFCTSLSLSLSLSFCNSLLFLVFAFFCVLLCLREPDLKFFSVLNPVYTHVTCSTSPHHYSLFSVCLSWSDDMVWVAVFSVEAVSKQVVAESVHFLGKGD